MIAPKDYSYEDFPASTLNAEGMVTMQANHRATGAAYIPDIPYGLDDNGEPLLMQLLLPVTDEPQAEPHPVIVFVQGSAWHKQNVHGSLPQLARLSRRGFAIAMPAYRPSDDAPFPAQVMDIKEAIRFLARHAEEYGLDKSRFSLMGNSSGAHTALLAAYTAETGKLDKKRGGLPVPIRSVVDFYGPTDISKMSEAPSIEDHIQPDSPEGFLIGRKNVLENPKLSARTVVMNQITAQHKLPPTMIVHGDKDRIVPFAQSVLLYEKLRRTGQEAVFYKLSGADHGGMAFWTQEMIDLTASFVSANMPLQTFDTE